MELIVREKKQGASGGSSLVSYRAKVEFTDKPFVHVELVSTIPDDASQDLIAQAIAAIRAGIELVLEPLKQGADVKIHDLTIHEVDFDPRSHTRVTAQTLEKHI